MDEIKATKTKKAKRKYVAVTYTPEEKRYFDLIYEYIKTLLKYEENMKLPHMAVNRIYAFRYGKTWKRGDPIDTVLYDYNVIHATIAIHEREIVNGLSTLHFKDDPHRINFIFMIINKHINEVSKLLKKSAEINQELEVADTTIMAKETPNYKVKSKETRKKLEELL